MARARAWGLAICPECSGRPLDGRWEGDHVAPLLADSPVVAVCRVCNRSKNNRPPTHQKVQNLLHSDRVVRNMSAEQMRAQLVSAAETLFGHRCWLDLLLTATPGRVGISAMPADERPSRSGSLTYANDKLREVGLLI